MGGDYSLEAWLLVHLQSSSPGPKFGNFNSCTRWCALGPNQMLSSKSYRGIGLDISWLRLPSSHRCPTTFSIVWRLSYTIAPCSIQIWIGACEWWSGKFSPTSSTHSAYILLGHFCFRLDQFDPSQSGSPAFAPLETHLWWVGCWSLLNLCRLRDSIRSWLWMVGGCNQLARPKLF